MSIWEIEEKDGDSRYTTILVQGWKEAGKWRRRFKFRPDAEAFIAGKSLENVTDSAGMRPVVTTLPAETVRDAENAVALLAAVGLSPSPSQMEAATHNAEHVRTTVVVEAVSIREARKACQSDKKSRGVLRARRAIQLESSLRLFEKCLLTLPRNQAQTIDPEWKPPVSGVTSAVVECPISVTACLDIVCTLLGIGYKRKNHPPGVDRPIPIVDTSKDVNLLKEFL